ncbi:MAG: hypothetical protein WCJ09_12590 [Planctomycetota bacterium]
MFWSCIRESVAWLHDFRQRRRVSKWTREQLEKDHSRRFRELVRFAARKSPYYEELLATHGLSPDRVTLEQIPPLTKQALIANFDRIVTDPAISTDRIREFLAREPDPSRLLDNKYYVIRTSGTSGVPAYTAFSVREWIRGCSLQIRYLPGLQWRRRLAFIGAKGDHYAGVSLTLTGERGINRLFNDCRAYDHNLLADVLVEELNKFQPHVLTAYANIHPSLMQQAIRGRLKIHPRLVVSSGEPLRPQLRTKLQDTYNTSIVDLYCARETLLIGSGTTDDGLMLHEDDTLVEVAQDHWLATNLFNRTVPLIRYRVNDVLELKEPPQSTTPFRWIKAIAGRNELPFELVNNDGDLEPISQMSLLYLPVPPLHGLQLVIHDSQNIEFRIVTSDQRLPFQRESLLRDVRHAIQNWLVGKRMDRNVRFEVKAVDQLAIDPKNGKAKLIIRNTSEKFRIRAA